MSYYTCIYYRNCQEYRRNQPKWVVVVFKNDCDELYGIHGALFHGNKQHAQRILDIYTETIKKAARKNGMRTLLETGLNAASNGLTTLEELIRETNVN